MGIKSLFGFGQARDKPVDKAADAGYSFLFANLFLLFLCCVIIKEDGDRNTFFCTFDNILEVNKYREKQSKQENTC